MSYEFLEHTADVKFKVVATDLEEAFIDSAKALMETIKGNLVVLEKLERKITIQGNDLENLLYNFLEEFLFLLDSEDFLISKIKSLEIDKDKKELNAVLVGDISDNYHFTNDVKAMTYNELTIKEGKKVVIKGVFDV